VKNWSGLIYLTSDPNGLRSLVRALDQPIRPIVKKAIFDVFFNIFNINMSYDEDKVKGNLKYFNSDNLLNTYMVMVLQAFYYCGIYDVLIKLATSADQELADLVNNSKF
jgi:rapamycin-insensitive companion of mTOR